MNQIQIPLETGLTGKAWVRFLFLDHIPVTRMVSSYWEKNSRWEPVALTMWMIAQQQYWKYLTIGVRWASVIENGHQP